MLGAVGDIRTHVEQEELTIQEELQVFVEWNVDDVE